MSGAQNFSVLHPAEKLYVQQNDLVPQSAQRSYHKNTVLILVEEKDQ
jgi:hypothetical protein